MKKRWYVLSILILLLFLPSCSKKAAEVESQSFIMLGTLCRISIYEGASEGAFTAAFARIKEVEERMSLHSDASEIAQVNAMAGIAPVAVSLDTFMVVAEALEFAALSDGAFDPTVGPLVKAWDIGFDGARLPEAQEIAALLPLIDYRQVELDAEEQTIYLPVAGMALDLGGIAKGYAADEAARVLVEHGVKAAIVNLGGNVLTVGMKADHSPWRIGVQDPESDRGEYSIVVPLTAESLVTSGPYERFFIHEGATYHHLLDTTTGYPAETSLSSASIISERSIVADALSTTLYILGADRGLALIETLDGVEAILFTEDKTILKSSGAPAITIVDPSYQEI